MKTAKQTQREARRLFRLCLVNGSLDEGRAGQVVQRLLERARPGALGVLSRFGRLVRLDRLAHSAEVESAEPLPADLRASIHENLMRLYGQSVTTSFSENPALIAGMRIRVGSDVYDGSVKGGLAALESRF